MSAGEIDRFDGEFAFLSNFYYSDIVYGKYGWCWPTIEHAFQAAKTLDDNYQSHILMAGTPGQAKRLGRSVALRPDWEQVKLGVMKELLALKFAPGTELAAKLIATGDRQLTEGNNWNDKYWGVCRGIGMNWLGRLLMDQRSFLQGESG